MVGPALHAFGLVVLFGEHVGNGPCRHEPHSVDLAATRNGAVEAGDRAGRSMAIGAGDFGRAPGGRVEGGGDVLSRVLAEALGEERIGFLVLAGE